MGKDFYDALGLDSSNTLGITDSDVKQAYYGLAKKWHPDSNSTPEATKRFRMVSEAYENLKTKDLRAGYRFELAEAGDDWSRSRQRNSRKATDADYKSNFNNVNIEYDAAEKKWRAKQSSSKTVSFFKSFEKTIHPKNLFFLIPLGILTYFGLRYTVSSISEIIDSQSPDQSQSESGSEGGGKRRKKTGASASRVGSVATDVQDDGMKVSAWFNTDTNRYETPAPWNKNFKYSMVQNIHRDLVSSSER